MVNQQASTPERRHPQSIFTTTAASIALLYTLLSCLHPLCDAFVSPGVGGRNNALPASSSIVPKTSGVVDRCHRPTGTFVEESGSGNVNVGRFCLSLSSSSTDPGSDVIVVREGSENNDGVAVMAAAEAAAEELVREEQVQLQAHSHSHSRSQAQSRTSDDVGYFSEDTAWVLKGIKNGTDDTLIPGQYFFRFVSFRFVIFYCVMQYVIQIIRTTLTRPCSACVPDQLLHSPHDLSFLKLYQNVHTIDHPSSHPLIQHTPQTTPSLNPHSHLRRITPLHHLRLEPRHVGTAHQPHALHPPRQNAVLLPPLPPHLPPVRTLHPLVPPLRQRTHLALAGGEHALRALHVIVDDFDVRRVLSHLEEQSGVGEVVGGEEAVGEGVYCSEGYGADIGGVCVS